MIRSRRNRGRFSIECVYGCCHPLYKSKSFVRRILRRRENAAWRKEEGV